MKLIVNFQENRSTFRNGWAKLRTLMPFLWPKKSFLLQLRVVFCFVLLFGGRVINLFVPIYNKKIGLLWNAFDIQYINLIFKIFLIFS